MEGISFHGNKIVWSITALLALALLTSLCSYRLKKTAELKLWEKKLSTYSLELEEENKIAKSDFLPEEK